MERQAYLWNLPLNREAHARRLVEIGVKHVRVKAGGDTGRLWAAWSEPAATRPYRDAGLRVTPWFYTWPVQSDIEVVVRAMRAQAFDEYALNPEVEWRWRNSNENPWNSFAEADAGARRWLAQMEAALPGVRRAFSGVPSWLDFPYQAWCEGCDQAEPQHYWPRHLLADFEDIDLDQVGYHRRFGGDAIPCVPIITACREYDDEGVVNLARSALTDFPSLDGFSTWEGANGGFQWEAMRRVYRLLPADNIVPGGTERERLLLFTEAIPFAARGPITREGTVDLRDFGGGSEEWLATYEKQRFHRLNGANYAFNLTGPATYEALVAAGKVTLF
jgi:hypothetical protein